MRIITYRAIMFRQAQHDRSCQAELVNGGSPSLSKAKYRRLQTIYFYAFKEGDYYNYGTIAVDFYFNYL